jgi:hypothetical protein
VVVRSKMSNKMLALHMFDFMVCNQYSKVYDGYKV